MPKLRSLELSIEDVKHNNPQWTDEMCRDYIAMQEDIKNVNSAVESAIEMFANLAGLTSSRDEPINTQLNQLNLFESINLTQVQKLIDPDVPRLQPKRKPHYARFYRNALSVPTTTAVAEQLTGFTVQKYGFLTTLDQIEITETATYYVGFSCYIENGTTDTQVEIYVNGAPVNLEMVSKADGHISMNAPIILNKGDILTLYVVQTSGGPVTIDFTDIHFTAVSVWDS